MAYTELTWIWLSRILCFICGWYIRGELSTPIQTEDKEIILKVIIVIIVGIIISSIGLIAIPLMWSFLTGD